MDPVCDRHKELNSRLRNITRCVRPDDYNAFLAMYAHQDHCSLCREAFTESNPPTLDRIDNELGHEITNVKLACTTCNVLRRGDDDKITRLQIQLAKYCKSPNHHYYK